MEDLPSFADPRCDDGVVVDPERPQPLGQRLVRVVIHDELRPRLGDPLGEDSVLRPEQVHRLLHSAFPAHEVGFLPRTLRVVARIPLVRRESQQVGHGKRQVRVDRDARPEAAEVVRVPEPELARHDLELDLLALRYPDRLARPLPYDRQRRVDRRLDRLGRQRRVREPARDPRRQVVRAGERVVEQGVRALELLLVDPARPDAVRQLDLLRVRQLLAGERSRGRLQGPHLRREPAVVELCQELRTVVGEARGLEQRLVCDPAREPRRPVVRVDELRRVPSEPQPELEVALGVRHRSNSAAWPWPTPTQRVASP